MIKKRLVELLADSRKYIVRNILWQWLALLANIAVIAAAAHLLEAAYEGVLDTKSLGISAVIFALCIMLRFLCTKETARASFHASRDVKQVLREKLYEKMLKLGTSYREQVPTSEVVQVSVEGVEQLEIYFGKYLPQLFYSLLAPVTLFGILAFVNLKTSLVLLACVPMIPVSIVAVQKFAKKLLHKYWGTYTELGDSFLENLQGLTTLKIYQADQKKAKEMDEESEKFRKVTMRVLTMQLNSVSVMDLIAYGGAAVGMIITVQEYAAGHVSLSGAVMILLLASEFFIPLRLLGSFFHIAMNGMAASDKIFKILDLPEPKTGGKELGNMESGIELESVGFSYEENRNILEQVSMEIPAGSFVSLVGASGCGKSTIAALLMGRNKGYEGHIRIGGAELSEISEHSLMSHITLVTHNSYLFKGTVKDNLTMGNPAASEEEMEAALKKVNLYGFLAGQQGLHTPLAEKAANLSGGQCQRLALARALLHDTDLYIFDEATSNIDVESEEQILQVIHELAKTKTVLLISHRLLNVVESDKIYVLNSGKIVEAGTHNQLMAHSGTYYGLYQNQQKLEAYGQKQNRFPEDDKKGKHQIRKGGNVYAS